MARIQAAQGPLREVLRWLERPAHGAGALTRKVKQAWGALRHCLDQLRALGPAYVGLEQGGKHNQLAPLEPQRLLRTTLAGMVRATLRAKDNERLRE